MKKSKISITGIVLIVLGLIGLGINTISFCNGWNLINPFCWGFSMFIKFFALIFGFMFLSIGLIVFLYRLIKGG